MHTFKFDNFDWTFFLANKENFEIAEKRLFCFGVPIYLDTQKVTLVLPKEFALGE